ncbi:hypothetical protein [Endozoicomonas sp. 8E]|uniref:hypothetical protein n=1 Tax=Endozoicomonas sp. 8E TaxID=3035692 RepID=UPI002938DF22|nr:hypothetical protein [Endozoicomonas sp. 8E]WOG27432.1 hypothetical protein P6910_23240 [Endozoicomonas sp. 8E]
MNKSLTVAERSSLLFVSLVACFPNCSSWADTVELNNNNFNQYLNADHPVKGDYQLISNIDLSQFLWKPIGNASVPFSLTLNGNGHVISGLKISTSTDNTTSGLFGSLQNSTIRQILFKKPKVTSTGFTSPAGALVGELKGSRIEEVVNYGGAVKTIGSLSHSGGIAGSVTDSIIHDSVNTGTVITTADASAGGIAGLAVQSSSLSNNLNTGKIASRNSYASPAGGIVGTLRNNSIANNNVNTGEVYVGFRQYSGGVAGEAQAAKVLHNLNTGKISSDYSRASSRSPGSSGGIVGHASGQTLVSKNLNTGSISTKRWHTYAGGIAGDVINAPVVQNVNVGTVTTQGYQASAGGITGEAEGTSVQDNLNAGAVITKGVNGDVGGITGAAVRLASVYNNVNTGLVEAQGSWCYVSPAAARVYLAGPIEHNLDTFTKYQWTSETFSGRNKGVVRLSKSALKSNLTGLNSTLWNAGNESQLPMLRGINIPYRELARISGNKFPTVLNEFADPGGVSNATSFNPDVWNSRDGYLPFPKVFSEPQTSLAGIDCTEGAFDCSEEKQQKTAHSPDLSDHCPPPEGIPLFQAYDPEKQQVYVVIQPEPSSESASKGIILARYKGPELDKQFGLCGVVTYTTSTNHATILASYQSLSGQIIHETTGPHPGSSLNIVAMTTSGKTTLFEFPLSATQRYQAGLGVRDDLFPENVQISDITHHQGVLYLTGKIDNSVFVGRYHQRQLFFPEKHPEEHPEKSGQYDEEQGLHLKLSADGERLYVAGKSDEDASHPLFIRQYDSKRLTPNSSFANNDKALMTINADDMDTVNSQQDILVQKDQVYVAVFSPEKEKLFIRRFAADNGQMDSAFIINDRTDFSSRTPGSFATVRLMATEGYLHAIIYNSDGQMSVFTYEDQVIVHRFDTRFKPAAAESMRPVFVGNKAYLAINNSDSEEGGRQVQMQEISLGPENCNRQKPSVALWSAESSAVISDWRTELIAGGAVVATAAVAVILVINKFKRSGMRTHK